MNKTLEQKLDKLNPALEDLQILIGKWKLSASHPSIPETISGIAKFNWVAGRAFVNIQINFDRASIPSSTAIIGSDDSAKKLSMLYFDERGVSRIYEMKFSKNIWEMWRDFPGFSQRFKGSFSDDNNIITGIWYLAGENNNWDRDLEITYKRIK